MKLYEIKDKYVEALREVCELNDCTPEEAAGMLDKLDGEVDDKVLAVAATIKNLEATILAMEKYIDDMITKKLAVSKKIQWLREYIRSNMIACHKKKISGIEVDVSIRNCRSSLKIDESIMRDPRFLRTETETFVDRNLLREHLEKGEVVEGAFLTPQTALFIS